MTLLASDVRQQITLAAVWLVVAAFIALLGPSRWRYWKRLLFPGIPASLAFYLVMVFATPYLDLVEQRFGGVIKSMAGRALVAGVVIILGIAAHYFKKKNQLLYGKVEAVFGAVSAYAIAQGMSPGQVLFSRWVALAGAAYVIARGMNNWSEAIEREGNRFGDRTVFEEAKGWIFVRESKGDPKERKK